MQLKRWLIFPFLFLFASLMVGLSASAETESLQTTSPPSLDSGWHDASADFELLTAVEMQERLAALQYGSAERKTAAPTASTDANDYIVATARGLENDPKLIFEFVNNFVDYDPVFGWRNDAPSTMMALNGSDADQATLFVELMREAGFTANYRIGIVTYDVATLANLVGSDNTLGAAANILANGGQSVSVNGANLDLIRVWAEATVGGQTFQFDPAMKAYVETASLDIGTVISYDDAVFRASALTGATVGADSIVNMNEANVRTALETHAMELVNHIETNLPTAGVEEIVSQREIVFTEVQNFSTNLPQALNVTSEVTITDLPASFRHSIRFEYEGIDHLLFADEISSGTLSLRFNGTNQPQLILNEVVLATGNALVFGDLGQMVVTIDHPYTALGGTFADQISGINIVVGDAYTFLSNFGAASLNLIDFHSERLFNAVGDAAENETMAIFANFWTHEARLLGNLIAQQADNIPLDHHTFGVVFNIDPANGGGHGVDIPFALTNFIQEDGFTDPTNAVFRAISVADSAFEHGMLEQMNDTINAVSTVAMLTNANAAGETIFLADLSNWTVGVDIRAQLTGYSPGDLALLDSVINAGLSMVVPKKGDLLVEQFEGFGVIGLSDTAIFMLINGGLLGGFSTTDDPIAADQIQTLLRNTKLDQKIDEQFAGVAVNNEPVEMAQGHYIFSKSDLRVGDLTHFGLDLHRNYNSGSNHALSSVSPMGNGWSHTLDITVAEFSNPDMAMGRRRAIDVAQAAVTAHILLDLLDVPTGSAETLTDWLSATLVANWHMEQLTNNAAIVGVAGQTMPYQRLADGSYAPPSTITHELTGQSGSYQLDFIDGSTIDFDADDRAQTWQDANGNTTAFTYVGDKLTQASTATGYSIDFTYSGDLLTSATDMSGRSISYGYDGSDNLTSYTDAEGHIWTYDYDADNRLTQLFRPLDAVTPMLTNSYDEIGKVIQQVDSLGNTETLFFAPFRTVEQNPDGSRNVFRYNSKGLWTVREDTVGNEVLLAYDGLYRLTSITGRDGSVSQFSYDLNTAALATQENGLGRVQTHTYATRPTRAGDDFDLTRIDFPDGTDIQIVYDIDGNMTQLTDQAGKVWTLTYNAQGLPLTLTNPDGGVVTNTHNADGTLASSTDSDVGVTTYSYDTLKRLTTLTRPDATTVTFTYDALDRLISVTDERGNSLSQTFDADGRRTKATDAAGNETLFGFDIIGQNTTVTNRTGDVTTFQYDSLYRVSNITEPSGVSQSFSYDNLGRATGITIAGFGATLTYSDEGFLTNINTPLGNDYGFTPDVLGLLTSAVDPLNRQTSVAYDELNRLSSVTDGLGRTTTYDYEDRGMLDSATQPVVGTATIQYGNLPVPTSINDFNANSWQYGYTTMGRRSSKTDPLNQVATFTYDSRGRRATAIYADGTTMTYTYDAASNITRQLYSDGTDLQTTFDNRDLPATTDGLQFNYDAEARVVNTTNVAAVNRSFGTTYDADGRVATVSYDGVFNVTYTYEALSGLIKTVTDSLTGSTMTFSYDLDLRLTGITRSNGVNTILTYDSASQLSRIQDGAILDLEYSYDAAGQITGLTMDAPLTPDTVLGADSGTHGFTFDAAAQVNSVGYTYDARGRLTADPDHAYSWDGDSRLAQIDTAVMTYTGFDDVQTRTDSGSTTTFHYNYAINDRPIVAEDVDGVVDRYYVYSPSGALLYMIDAANSNAPRFYHFDILGSTLALSDGAGTVTDSYAYSPFGKLLGQTGSSAQPFKFVGGRGVRHEGGTLYQMRARYYDAETQRFLSREPVWPDLFNPQRLNPYQYAENEPVSTSDSSGLTPEGGASGMGLPPVTHQSVLRFALLLIVALGLLWVVWNSARTKSKIVPMWLFIMILVGGLPGCDFLTTMEDRNADFHTRAARFERHVESIISAKEPPNKDLYPDFYERWIERHNKDKSTLPSGDASPASRTLTKGEFAIGANGQLLGSGDVGATTTYFTPEKDDDELDFPSNNIISGDQSYEQFKDLDISSNEFADDFFEDDDDSGEKILRDSH